MLTREVNGRLGREYRLFTFASTMDMERQADLIPVKFVSEHSVGTTNEEVLRMLIHRMEVLQSEYPCDYNVKALEHLNGALEALVLREFDEANLGGATAETE